MASYPTTVFIELLNDLQPRIKWLREKSYNGITANHYESVSGELVMIDSTDDTIEEIEGREFLRQLELYDLVDVLFP